MLTEFLNFAIDHLGELGTYAMLKLMKKRLKPSWLCSYCSLRHAFEARIEKIKNIRTSGLSNVTFFWESTWFRFPPIFLSECVSDLPILEIALFSNQKILLIKFKWIVPSCNPSPLPLLRSWFNLLSCSSSFCPRSWWSSCENVFSN